ncbi:uncharacterized protein KGF55_002400 [Candida pseudojiufengensis]|uniref:uncharacterized protein n=1 Tax=Candida pseudojiufengensis TaxID=497109 RepID=UPI002224095F|nr:uncharacterized protein KGF55_002400 [Candida pseudojiufengensis]KAI5963520.1 hypothetical protein KGF55_002400 [Candida pseudojiufengensis]
MFKSPYLQTIIKRSFTQLKQESTTRSYSTFKYQNPISTVFPNTKSHYSSSIASTLKIYSKNSSNSSSSSSIFKLLFASAGASILITTSFTKLFINNDTAVTLPRQQISNDVRVNKSTGKTESRFNGLLNYEELTIGSITGLFIGIILGKLSQVFLFVSLSSFFLIEFLENKNIISIPWNSIISIGSKKIDLKQLIFKNPSFKISFILSLIIAAYNV